MAPSTSLCSMFLHALSKLVACCFGLTIYCPKTRRTRIFGQCIVLGELHAAGHSRRLLDDFPVRSSGHTTPAWGLPADLKVKEEEVRPPGPADSCKDMQCEIRSSLASNKASQTACLSGKMRSLAGFVWRRAQVFAACSCTRCPNVQENAAKTSG